MRTIIIAALLVMTMALECDAASKVIGEDRAAIGGITIGSKVDYVRSIYGEPDKIIESLDGRAVEWYYGETFQIRFVEERAVFVCSSANNGLNTPDNVGVGMKSRLVKKVFGRPSEKLKFDRRQVYVYNGSGAWQMLFVINDDWITEIRLTVNE